MTAKSRPVTAVEAEYRKAQQAYAQARKPGGTRQERMATGAAYLEALHALRLEIERKRG